jgi:predicted methyltransferase
LSEKGMVYVEENLGIKWKKDLICPTCEGKKIPLTEEFGHMFDKLEETSKLRPKPLSRLDQAFALPETSMRRALLMLSEGDLEGRNILLLGDDDLTSIALGLFRLAGKITVFDVDSRLLGLIEGASNSEDLGIECVHHDLRNPLPGSHRSYYDVVFTDPPYTLPALNLFLSRGISALKEIKSSSIYLAFAEKPPLEMLGVQEAINRMGLYLKEIIPRFNNYEGAEIFANTTFLAKLSTTEVSKPCVEDVFREKMYTGEIRPTTRVYRCGCKKKFKVGIGMGFQTIEELKSGGCPSCGRKSGFKLLKRTIINDLGN